MSRSNAPYGLTWPQTSGVSPRASADVMRAIHAGSVEHALQHQRVHVDQAGLQQVQRMNRHFLVVEPVAGNLTALAEEDEPIGASSRSPPRSALRGFPA